MSSPNFLFAVELKQAFYTYKQTAELLAVGEHFVKQLVQSGELKRIFLAPESGNKQPRITCTSILRFIKAKDADETDPLQGVDHAERSGQSGDAG